MNSKIPTCLLLSILFSCGGGDSGNSDEFNRQSEEVPEPETIQKVYRTDLKAINPSLSNNINGQAILRLEDENFEVNVVAQNIPSVIHPQHIRTGKVCPSSASDVNRDGIIDLNEAEAVSGGVYIPLDNDLKNLVSDNSRYPNGGFLRAYAYREDTSRKQVVTELGPETNLDLDNRVIMILGVDADEDLPPTVASPDGRTPQETLPLACGELFKVIGP